MWSLYNLLWSRIRKQHFRLFSFMHPRIYDAIARRVWIEPILTHNSMGHQLSQRYCTMHQHTLQVHVCCQMLVKINERSVFRVSNLLTMPTLVSVVHHIHESRAAFLFIIERHKTTTTTTMKNCVFILKTSASAHTRRISSSAMNNVINGIHNFRQTIRFNQWYNGLLWCYGKFPATPSSPKSDKKKMRAHTQHAPCVKPVSETIFSQLWLSRNMRQEKKKIHVSGDRKKKSTYFCSIRHRQNSISAIWLWWCLHVVLLILLFNNAYWFRTDHSYDNKYKKKNRFKAIQNKKRPVGLRMCKKLARWIIYCWCFLLRLFPLMWLIRLFDIIFMYKIKKK